MSMSMSTFMSLAELLSSSSSLPRHCNKALAGDLIWLVYEYVGCGDFPFPHQDLELFCFHRRRHILARLRWRCYRRDLWNAIRTHRVRLLPSVAACLLAGAARPTAVPDMTELVRYCFRIGHPFDIKNVVKTPEDARDNKNHALRWACHEGHLHVVQWLVKTFALTANDARACHNSALRWACRGGHLNVAKWLVETFALTAKDMRACNNAALRLACSQARLNVVQWLMETFALTLTPKDARADYHEVLCLACRGGYLPVLKWLVETFALTSKDVRGYNNNTLHWTLQGRHRNRVLWWRETFALTTEEERARHNDKCCVA